VTSSLLSDDEPSIASTTATSVPEDEQLMLPLADLLLEGERSMAPPRQKRIYCNRNLRLDQVDFVGFDMDYTLAIYNQPEMDRLSIEATAKKLVEKGYPDTLLTMPYRTDFAIRGLLIDKKLGNVLKMDRYRYVKKAYHGMRELSRDERRSIYHQQRVRAGTSRYHWVDTLYALSEVSVYVAVIDELERQGIEVDYQKLFTDVRACIDLAHQDGSILDTIESDFPRFLRRDPELGATLHKLRSAGKKLFLLTNSRHGYTEKAMHYLVGGALPEYPSWRNYFDVVITAAGKPRFFAEQNPLLIVDADGSTTKQATSLEADKIYAAGNILQFEQLIGAAGDRVLYVGDHIYGDVLRAKKETGWRTAMILQEMAEEIGALEQYDDTIRRLDSLGSTRDDLYDELRARQRRFKDLGRWTQYVAGNPATAGASLADIEAARIREKRAIDRVRLRLKEIESEYDAIEGEVDAAFHPFWGSIFKAGPEVTIFGDQVEQYACLYTERVSNLLYYSPMHYFRSPRDRMPHE
jgi:5'-nucleotidase